MNGKHRVYSPGPNLRLLFLTLLTGSLAPTVSFALDVDWKIYEPSNTGVPGERVNFATFGPDGHLWVSAYWPLWNEGGVGIYDIAEQTWTNYANWETPLPSAIVTDVDLGPAGVIWFGTTNGLVYFSATGNDKQDRTEP